MQMRGVVCVFPSGVDAWPWEVWGGDEGRGACRGPLAAARRLLVLAWASATTAVTGRDAPPPRSLLRPLAARLPAGAARRSEGKVEQVVGGHELQRVAAPGGCQLSGCRAGQAAHCRHEDRVAQVLIVAHAAEFAGGCGWDSRRGAEVGWEGGVVLAGRQGA